MNPVLAKGHLDGYLVASKILLLQGKGRGTQRGKGEQEEEGPVYRQR